MYFHFFPLVGNDISAVPASVIDAHNVDTPLLPQHSIAIMRVFLAYSLVVLAVNYVSLQIYFLAKSGKMLMKIHVEGRGRESPSS